MNELDEDDRFSRAYRKEREQLEMNLDVEKLTFSTCGQPMETAFHSDSRLNSVFVL